MKAAFGDQLLIQDHLEPVYRRGGELTIPDAQAHGNSGQGPPQLDVIDGRGDNFFLAGLTHDHDLWRALANNGE